MMWPGLIGGNPGYSLLRRISDGNEAGSWCDSSAYSGKSKLQNLFGKDIWQEIRGKTVLDFGCGSGTEVIEMAQHGAEKAIGIDNREKVLDKGRKKAADRGVSAVCEFNTRFEGRVDVAFSIDGFEHYDDPLAAMQLLRRYLKVGGRLYISFGPPWFHPYGGHLFSVFPWAHLVFTEQALLRWRADFKSDGATRFHEVEGGLNQMTVRRFRKLVNNNDFRILDFEMVPIRRMHWLSNPLTREWFTSVVRCVLVRLD